MSLGNALPYIYDMEKCSTLAFLTQSHKFYLIEHMLKFQIAIPLECVYDCILCVCDTLCVYDFRLIEFRIEFQF